MRLKGYQMSFDCKNGEQYEAIGKFWDTMADLFGRENLFGVGYGWQNDTFCYLIGTKDMQSAIDNRHIKEVYKEIEITELELPDSGWQTYRGKTDNLPHIYDEIYKQGSLDYEIEQFSDDGACEIAIYRATKA